MGAKTKTVLFILGSFVLGAAAGVVAMKYGGVSRGEGRYQSQADVVKAFSERLHLDTRQTAEVDSILERRRLKLNVYRTAMLAARDSTRQEIRKILSPEQNKLFDEYIQEMNAREERYRASRQQH